MKKVLLLLLLLFFVSGCSNDNNKQEIVNVLNWSAYIPDEVIHNFEDEYKIKVNYGTYSSNEELLAKITNSKEGTYDVIFPSDYMIELMIERNLIQKIDKSRLYNIRNINSIFLNQSYDLYNDYSLPFLSTIVVMAVNRDKIKEDIRGYNDLLNSEYKNDIILLDDQRIIIGMALLANGYDMNTTDDYELSKAKEWLLKLKKNVKAYDSDSPKSFFITKEADIGVLWNAEAELAQLENSNVEIIYPREGHAISSDNYAIVKGAKNVDNAYLFINYLLRNDVSDKITREYPYISSCRNVHNSIITTEKVFEKGYYVKNIGESIRNYDKLWADIK